MTMSTIIVRFHRLSNLTPVGEGKGQYILSSETFTMTAIELTNLSVKPTNSLTAGI